MFVSLLGSFLGFWLAFGVALIFDHYKVCHGTYIPGICGAAMTFFFMFIGLAAGKVIKKL